MTIQQQMIKEVKTKYENYRSYKNVDFYTIWGGNSGTDDSFISREGLTFEDYVGSMNLTGNELLYYPKLAKKIREIKEYPTLKRTYKVDEEIKGIPFIEYFCKRVREGFDNFQAELALASCEFNNLIHLHGMERKTPIIDRIENEDVHKNLRYKKLVINDVIWHLDGNYGKCNPIEYIELYGLLGISRDFHKICLEDAALGTSFIALRIGKTWAHKGHVTWYNLDTLEKVSKSDVPKVK